MRTNERGSVVGYVLGAVLLLGLLVGGIALYKNYAGQPGGSSTGDQVATQDTDSDDTAAQNEAALKQQQEEAEKKAQEQNSATNNSNSSTTEVPHTATAPAGSLPATGPEDTFVTIASLALLSGAVVAYVRSRIAL